MPDPAPELPPGVPTSPPGPPNTVPPAPAPPAPGPRPQIADRPADGPARPAEHGAPAAGPGPGPAAERAELTGRIGVWVSRGRGARRRRRSAPRAARPPRTRPAVHRPRSGSKPFAAPFRATGRPPIGPTATRGSGRSECRARHRLVAARLAGHTGAMAPCPRDAWTASVRQHAAELRSRFVRRFWGPATRRRFRGVGGSPWGSSVQGGPARLVMAGWYSWQAHHLSGVPTRCIPVRWEGRPPTAEADTP